MKYPRQHGWVYLLGLLLALPPVWVHAQQPSTPIVVSRPPEEPLQEGDSSEGDRPAAPEVVDPATLGEVPPQEPHGQLDGEWYSAAVSCTFCDTVFGQEISVNPRVLYKYADKALVDPDLKGGKMLLRAEKSLVDLKLVQRKDGSLLFVLYNEGDLPRVGETFARVWHVSLTGNDKLLYGRAYSIYSYSPDAFDDTVGDNRYRARPDWLNLERLEALVTDIRVSSLTSDRRLWVPTNDVRVSYEGATALVRLDLSPMDMMSATEEARKRISAKGDRENLYRTLIASGDSLYGPATCDKAMEQYQAASSIVPENALAYADLGACQQLKGKFAEAKRSYQTAIDLSLPDPDLYFNMAVVYEGTEEWATALVWYKKVLEMRPADPEAQERMIILTTRLGKR